jgi:hypothetical protein
MAFLTFLAELAEDATIDRALPIEINHICELETEI